MSVSVSLCGCVSSVYAPLSLPEETNGESCTCWSGLCTHSQHKGVRVRVHVFMCVCVFGGEWSRRDPWCLGESDDVTVDLLF